MAHNSTSWSIQGNTKAGATSSTTDALTTGALTVSGAGQFNNTLTVGVDDTGYDVKFFGDTASHYMLWDASADTLKINSTGNGANILLTSSDTDSNLGPGITLERTATGADSDSLGKLDFYGRDAGGNSTLYGRIYSQILTATDGSEVGSLQLKAMTESASGNEVKTGLWIKGSSTNDTVTCNIPNGGVIVGQNSTVRGTLTLWDGAGTNTPGYIKFAQPDGDISYVWVDNDGKLRIDGSIPSDSGGTVVGSQS
tara:strand:+ start:1344 stop:2105 length:762 start_codon:yes stop_codon:yes gene_type:complete